MEYKLPNCNDPVRAKLVNYMAFRSSMAGAEALLENAVKYREREKIKTATSMLQHILSKHKDAETDASFIRLGKHGDAFQGELRPVECKPDDCTNCFWHNWCELKEYFDLAHDWKQALKHGIEIEKNIKMSRTVAS